MTTNRPVVNAQKTYKGCFNYYINGVLKSYNYERKTGTWVKKMEESLIKRHGANNLVGYTAWKDDSKVNLSAPSIFSNKVNLATAFGRFIKSYL